MVVMGCCYLILCDDLVSLEQIHWVFFLKHALSSFLVEKKRRNRAEFCTKSVFSFFSLEEILELLKKKKRSHTHKKKIIFCFGISRAIGTHAMILWNPLLECFCYKLFKKMANRGTKHYFSYFLYCAHMHTC